MANSIQLPALSFDIGLVAVRSILRCCARQRALGRSCQAPESPFKNLPSNRQRVLNANHTAHDLLKELGRGQNAARPAPKVVNFLRQVEDLSTPLTDWQDELGALREEMQAIKAAVEPPARQMVRSFAEMVRTAPAPAHYLSSSSSSSSPARPAEHVTAKWWSVLAIARRSVYFAA
jgi:hypothetical protein